MLTKRPVWSFAHEAASVALSKHFGSTSLEGFGFGDDDVTAIRAAGAVLEYLCETQRASLDHIERLVPYCRGGALEIDESTRRSLEITRTIREGNRDGSLLSVIDRTVTAMGSRLLADWIANPLTDIKGINVRLDAVGELNAQAALRDGVRTQLGSVYDLERLLATRHHRSRHASRSELYQSHAGRPSETESQTNGESGSATARARATNRSVPRTAQYLECGSRG